MFPHLCGVYLEELVMPLKTRSEKKSALKKAAEVKKKSSYKKKERKVIQSKEVYDLTMREIDSLMKRGEANLTTKELNRLRSLAEAAERYEDTYEPLPLPEALPEMIRMRMHQMHITQGFTAKLLGVSDTKLSLIMNGKQKPDIPFIKAIHEKLNVDANLLLRAL